MQLPPTIRINQNFRNLLISSALGVVGASADADEITMLFEDFGGDARSRWTYVADGVMGGVSQGQARMVETDQGPAVRLRGEVSTENNGGFIQVRNRFAESWPDDAKGLRISTKGNGEIYYVFLRTQGLTRVWHSYRVAFATSSEWSQIEMDFSDFRMSHDGMPVNFSPSDVRSIGIVAYGREHTADVTVGSIALY